MKNKQNNLAVSAPTKEDTLEQRIMKSNLSDDDKIELIKKLAQQPVYVYPYQYPYWSSTYCTSTPVSYTTTGNLTCESQTVTR